MFAKIVAGLADLDAAGQGSDAAARAGFLEWVMTLPQDIGPRRAARSALAEWYDGAEFALLSAGSVADHGPTVRAFVTHLHAATQIPIAPVRKGGAAGRRRLH